MKYILKMAFRNVRRNRRRSFLSATAISIAVMMVLLMRGYIGGIMDSSFDSLTKIETGHIKIMHSEYYEKEDMMPLEYTVDGFDGAGYKQLVPILESVEGVRFVIPRIKFGVLLSFGGKSRSAIGIGIDPSKESLIIPFNKLMVKGKYLETKENPRSVIIGEGLANKLRIETGDKLTVVARTAYDSLKGMTFDVTGTFRYGISLLDDKLFYIPISSAARLLEMGNGVNELILMVDKPEDAEKIADRIEDKLRYQEREAHASLAIIPWQKRGGYLSLARSIQRIYNIVYVGLLVLASTVIANTTMMVIYERIREIGTIGALGMTGGQIVWLFTMESAIVSAMGSILGTAIGGGLDLLLSITGIDIKSLSGGSVDWPATDIIYPRFGLSLLIGSFLFGVIVASAVAYIPARRAAKIEPVEALRSV